MRNRGTLQYSYSKPRKYASVIFLQGFCQVDDKYRTTLSSLSSFLQWWLVKLVCLYNKTGEHTKCSARNARFLPTSAKVSDEGVPVLRTPVITNQVNRLFLNMTNRRTAIT